MFSDIEVRRFFAKVAQDGDCWRWTGRISSMGYGYFQYGGKQHGAAHRWSYTYMRAEIAEGLVLDHLCRNRWCVNPWHVEPVTQKVNVRRGDVFKRRDGKCHRGHPWIPENIYTQAKTGSTSCKECRRIANRKYDIKRGRVAA